MVDTTSHSRTLAVVGAGGQSKRLEGDIVPSNYFDLLGVKMSIGRGLLAEDDEPGSSSAAILLSHECWATYFQKDAGIVGRPIKLDGRNYIVVGIAPAGFGGLSEPWKPASFWTTPAHFYGPAYYRATSYIIGRLRPGVTLDQARYIGQSPIGPRQRGAVTQLYTLRAAREVITPFEPDATSALRQIASTAMVVIGAVLVIAAINITGFFMARGISRARDVAVRRALGASGLVLSRHLFLETLSISLLGGCIGLGVATALVRLYQAFTPDRFRVDLAVDMTVMAFVLGACVLVAVVVGVAPALQARKVNIVEVLGGGQGAGVPRSTLRGMRLGVVLPQVVLAIALLIVAGVHARALARVELANLGYRSADVVVATVAQEDAGPAPGTREESAERTRAFFRSVLIRARETNPNASIALLSMLPHAAPASPLRVISRESLDADAPRVAGAAVGYVSDGLFSTLGIPLVAGRDISASDTASRPPVAIVSTSLARQLWGQHDSVGKFLGFYSSAGNTREWLEVIGAVGDIQPALPDGRERPFVYRPVEQIALPGPYPLEVAAYGPVPQSALEVSLRDAVASSSPNARVWNVESMADIIDEALYLHRIAAWMLGLSGLAGLGLASIGTYGIVSHAVAQRLRDIAIRATLGATPKQLIGLTVREATALSAIAIIPAGLLAHWGLRITGRLVGSVPTFDYTVFMATSLTMVVVVFAAAYLPAKRAAHSDPLETLRIL